MKQDESRALLRQSPTTTVYYIEVQLDSAVPSLEGHQPADGRPASLLKDLNTYLRHKKQIVQRADDVMLCAPDGDAFTKILALRSGGHGLTPQEVKLRVCEGKQIVPWRYYFWLTGAAASPDGYAVFYDFNDAAGTNHADNLVAQTDFEAELVAGDGSGGACKFSDNVEPPPSQQGGANRLPGGKIRPAYQGSLIPLKISPRSAVPAEPADDAKYRDDRLKAIFNQLKVSNTVLLEIEPREDEVEKEPVKPAITLLNYRPRLAQETTKQGALVICIEPERELPVGEFHVRLNFGNNPPVELLGPLTQTYKFFTPTGKAPDPKDFVDKATLGMRSLTNRLDFAVAVTSSVNDVDKEVEGQKVKVRERKTDGIFDFIVAPIIKRRQDPPGTGQWVRYAVTPIFLDAKISTGKINKDSLSVNRFILGYEREYRYYQSTVAGNRNHFSAFGRLLHTSDRDLKRPEVKAQFEFRPSFDALNEPLEYDYFETVIDPKREDKRKLKDHFGYHILPFFGAEAGRTYRVGRTPFSNEETGRNIYRLFFGTNINLLLTEKVTFTLHDTFYVRGEADSDRGHNYFKGEVNFFFNDSPTTPAQALFVSFERGNLPPFATKDANVFKVGYRVRSNLPGLLGPR
jgi:hypothetical protein